MLMTQYTYLLWQDDRGTHIKLMHKELQEKVKHFFIAGQRDPGPIHSHMRSLTDELCDGFFPDPNRRKKKEKKPKEETVEVK